MNKLKAVAVSCIASLLTGSGLADVLTWTGKYSDIWDLTEKNWTNSVGEEVEFSDGDSVLFTVDGGKSLTVEIGSNLTVSNAVFNIGAESEMTLITNVSAKAITECLTFTKMGDGTLTIEGNVNSSTNAIVVEGGVLRGGGKPNTITFGFGNAEKGYSVEVMEGATFWNWSRNTMGGDTKMGNVRITVHTNGVYSMALRSETESFIINSAKVLALDGGTLVKPLIGHPSGFLRISELMSFGGLNPYVFTAEDQVNKGHHIRIEGEQVEFRVPDITGSAAESDVVDDLADVTFDLPFSAYKASVEAGHKFGILKTGQGKMVVTSNFVENNKSLRLNGDLTVSEGVFEIGEGVDLFDGGVDGRIRVNTNATLVLHANASYSEDNLKSNEYRSVEVDHGRLVFDNGGDVTKHIAFGDLTLDHAELDLSNWMPHTNYGQLSFHGKVTLRGDKPFVFTCHPETYNTTLNGRIGFASIPRRTEIDIIDITGDSSPDCIISNIISSQRLHGEKRWIPAGLIKRGNGTLALVNTSNEFDGDIDVYEGELWAGPDEALSKTGFLGVMNEDRTITVHPGATLYLPNRNLFGTQGGITNVGPSGTLVIGGVLKTGLQQGFILPDITITNGGQIARGYGPSNYGRFMVREKFKVTGNAPFVWEASLTDAGENNKRWDALALTLNGYPENIFEIDDVTGNSSVDATFGIPFIIGYGYFRKDTADGDHYIDDWKFGFRKTGLGTMRITAPKLIQTHKSTKSGRAALSINGDPKVEEGELRVDGDLSLSDTVRVYEGAYLSGTGLVNNVSIAQGGGFRVRSGQKDKLQIKGNLAIGENVVIDVDLAEGESVTETKAEMFTVDGVLSGIENLSSAKILADGVSVPNIKLRFKDNGLSLRYMRGTTMVIR